MKKIVSVVLIISMFFTFSMSGFAAENNVKQVATNLTIEELEQELNNIPEEIIEQFPELREVISKAKLLMKTERNPKRLEEKLMKTSEYKKLQKVGKKVEEESDKLLRKKYKEDEREKVAEYMQTNEYKEMEETVNRLAQEIYDFHKEYGRYPSESELSMTNTINLASTGYVVDTLQL